METCFQTLFTLAVFTVTGRLDGIKRTVKSKKNKQTPIFDLKDLFVSTIAQN